MKEFNATFDSVNDQPKKPVPGKYPSHVSGFEAVSLKSGAKVFNIDFTLANECKNMSREINVQLSENVSGSVVDDNYKPKTESLAYMAGKQYRSAGVFLTPNLPSCIFLLVFSILCTTKGKSVSIELIPYIVADAYS